jgi:hypothetical protein
MVSVTARLAALSRRWPMQTPGGAVVIYATRDADGLPLADDAIRRWQDAARQAQPPDVRAVIFMPEKDPIR